MRRARVHAFVQPSTLWVSVSTVTSDHWMHHTPTEHKIEYIIFVEANRPKSAESIPAPILRVGINKGVILHMSTTVIGCIIRAAEEYNLQESKK